MKRFFFLLIVMFAACGGNVVVDTPNASTGQGAQGSGGAGTGTGTGAGASTTISSTTPLPSCQTNACSGGSNGSCACTGSCTNGDSVSATCPGGGAACTCSLMGQGISKVGQCMPGTAALPCDIALGCCASFF